MPTLSQMNIPTPKSWDEFEEMTLDALKTRWNTTDLTRYGRQGQPQNGIDIYGRDDLYRFVGIQCKKYDINLSVKTIEEEIGKAKNFLPPVECLYFATTLPRDAKLQTEVLLISKERVENKKFPIGIFFWEDIIQDLMLNEQIFAKHYPQLFNFPNKTINKNLSGLLDITYWGLNFKFYMDLIFGPLCTNPLEMEAICEMVNNGSQLIKSETTKNSLCNNINSFKNYVFNGILCGQTNDWQPAINLATNVQNIISSLESILEPAELLIYKIGELLAYWDRLINTNDSIISEDNINRFLSLISKLSLDIRYLDNINAILKNDLNNSELLSRVNIITKIYNYVREALIMKSIL